MITTSFASVKDAFEYFASFGSSKQVIYKLGFDQAMDNLFPQRFSDKDKDNIWMMVSEGGALSLQHFTRLFNQAEFSGNVSLNG